MAYGGGSADERARELGDDGDPSAGAWAAGAEGERRVAAALAAVGEPWTVLHDRLLRPGLSEANLDHVVVGPAGLLFLDAKNWSGRVVEWNGTLYQHTRDPSGAKRHQSLARELAKVNGMAAAMATTMGVPVLPAIVLAGAQAAGFGEPQLVRGVWVVPVDRVVGWLLARPVVFAYEAIGPLVTRTMTEFPSTTTHPELLAAMGAASRPARTPRGRGRPARTTVPSAASSRPQSRRTPKPRVRKKGRAGNLVRAISLLAVGWFFLTHVADVSGLASDVAVKVRSSTLPTVAPPAVSGPARCAGLTDARVTAILKVKRVQPISSTVGCVWGTRIDDEKTTLLEVRAVEEIGLRDPAIAASREAGRAVYSDEPVYRGALVQMTILDAAAGVPFLPGGTRKAPTNVSVRVARERLHLTDGEARAVARSVAAASRL